MVKINGNCKEDDTARGAWSSQVKYTKHILVSTELHRNQWTQILIIRKCDWKYRFYLPASYRFIYEADIMKQLIVVLSVVRAALGG